ncbi:MAG: hypothetical protein HFF84_06380 [Oscillibacter sp.]|nr:hypothetical protein [Oscillibacter sp.]
MAGIAVPYVTNRAIMNRLDTVVGPDGWYNEFKPWHGAGKKEAQICGISVFFEDRGFITKWDGAEDSDIEPIKGGLSDSMKRAAVQWGIGRVLYNMDTVFVDVEQRGKSWIIKKSARAKLDKAYLDMLKALKLEPASAGGIQSLLAGSAGEPDNTPRRTGTPAIPSENTQPAPEKKQERLPKTACIVTEMQKHKGMNSTNTRVKLKNAEGKEISAFVQREHPMLVSGTVLVNTKLTTKQQDSVAYYVLESYEIVPPDQRAA